MTEKEHLKKTVVILAGYPGEMKRLLSTNPGLKSRVSDVIDFPDFDAAAAAPVLGAADDGAHGRDGRVHHLLRRRREDCDAQVLRQHGLRVVPREAQGIRLEVLLVPSARAGTLAARGAERRRGLAAAAAQVRRAEDGRAAGARPRRSAVSAFL